MNNKLAYLINLSKSKKAAIYGLGENARLLIDNSNHNQFVCLVANDHFGEEKYGLKILSIEDAVKEVEVIIIAASFSATSIIYSRIKDIVPKNIQVFNMLGEELSSLNTCESNPYLIEDYSNLIAQIEAHDVISFDIFDTLLMRDVLEPKDIFKIISNKYNDEEFYNARIESEKKCRLRKNEPMLEDIYSDLSVWNDNNKGIIGEIIQLELSTEFVHILPRNRMVDALNYALSHGKKVFLTSDMYINKKEITDLLSRNDICGDYELIISCEYGCSKFSGELYRVLKDKARSSSILHIGDDELVDKNKAAEMDIDSYLIYSSYRMLAISRDAYIFDTVKTFSDKNYLGFYISNVLNDPFSLHGLEGKINIFSEKDIALILFPITKVFLDFIIFHSSDYDCLLFPSRDGYFLYNYYIKYKDAHSDLNLPEAKYIYSSRMSLSRVALKSEKNLDVLIHKLFGNMSKNCKKYVKDLFGYELPMEFDHSCGELIDRYGKDGLLSKLHYYVPQMIDYLSDGAMLYSGYVDSLRLPEYEKIALIDIVSYGTQPYCLSEILGKPVDMISIGSSGIPNVFLGCGRVRSIYGNVNEEINGTIVSQSDMSILHLLLEVLYSSKDGQFLGMANTGEPEFLSGSEYNSSLLEGVQTELVYLFEHYGKGGDVSTDFSPGFCHAMLRILRSNHSVISDDIKQKLVFSDPYDGGFVKVNLSDSL